MKEKSLKKNYFFNLLFNLTNLLVPLIVAPYLSRILEVEGVGIKSYTLSIVSNFILFASLGVSEYGQLEISKNRDNRYIYSKKLYEISLLRVFTTFIVLLVYISIFLNPMFNSSYKLIYTILIINIIANMLDFSWFLRGIEEFKCITYVQISTRILMLILTVIFVKSKQDLAISILINSITILLNSLLPLFKIKKYCVKVKISDLKIIKHIKECVVFFIPAIAIQVYTVLDKTMIGFITNSSTENGYYEQADKIIRLAITIIATTNTLMNSRIAYLYKDKKIEQIKNLTNKSLSLCTLISIPICFGVISIASVFIPLFFGNGYEKSINILILLAPLSIIIGISGLLGSHYYTPLGKKRISNKFLIIGSIVNLILNFILIPKFKSLGAAISSVIAEFIITCLYIKNCNKEIINLKMLLSISYKYIIAAIVMYISIQIFKIKLEVNIFSLLLLICMGCLVYAFLIVVLKDKYVLNQLKEIKKKICYSKGRC